jgi:hypothetical protein
MSEITFRDHDALVPILEARVTPGYLIPCRPPAPSELYLDPVRVRHLSDSSDEAASLLAAVFNPRTEPPDV